MAPAKDVLVGAVLRRYESSSAATDLTPTAFSDMVVIGIKYNDMTRRQQVFDNMKDAIESYKDHYNVGDDTAYRGVQVRVARPHLVANRKDKNVFGWLQGVEEFDISPYQITLFYKPVYLHTGEVEVRSVSK